MVIYEILQSSKNEWTTGTYDNMDESLFFWLCWVLVGACGISSLTRDQIWTPSTGSSES